MQQRANVLSLHHRTRQPQDLVSLVAPVLQKVLRVRDPSEPDAPTPELRREFSELIDELEAQCKTLRYSSEDIEAVKFALAAFVDAMGLDRAYPFRSEWATFTLQHEYFVEHTAGENFIKRLEALRQRPGGNAEVVEVYYLCLLLGYKGGFKRYKPEQLPLEIEKTAQFLRDAGRLRADVLSPNWWRDDQPPLPRDPGLPRWAKLGTAALVATTLLLFLVLKFFVEGDVADAQQRLLR